MYRFAEYLIETGYAYVDQQSADDIRANRGTLTQVGSDSPYRDRPIAESLRLFREMRAGKHAEGSMVLRAKIDMASPNINMRDPVIYRIRFAEHHMTGTKWVVYPLYAYAHPIEDALENITHSICTLEFEDQRPWYDWVLERIVPLLRRPQYEAAQRMLGKIYDAGIESRREFALHCAASHGDKLGASRYERRAEAMFASWSKNSDLAAHDADEFFKLLREQTQCFTPLLQAALDERKANPFLLPHQHEFNRLAVTYVVTSKRKLFQMVDERTGRRLGRPAHADHRRTATTRLHAAKPAAFHGSHRRQQIAAVDRLRAARTSAARRSRTHGAARHRGAAADQAGARQLPRRSD